MATVTSDPLNGDDAPSVDSTLSIVWCSTCGPLGVVSGDPVPFLLAHGSNHREVI